MTDIVLVHGAFRGGWAWDRVRPILEDDPPPLPGEPACTADPVILVCSARMAGTRSTVSKTIVISTSTSVSPVCRRVIAPSPDP